MEDNRARDKTQQQGTQTAEHGVDSRVRVPVFELVERVLLLEPSLQAEQSNLELGPRLGFGDVPYQAMQS